VDAPSISAFISRLVLGTSGWAFSWISPLSPRPYWLDDLLVRLHEVYHKVYHKCVSKGLTYLLIHYKSLRWRFLQAKQPNLDAHTHKNSASTPFHYVIGYVVHVYRPLCCGCLRPCGKETCSVSLRWARVALRCVTDFKAASNAWDAAYCDRWSRRLLVCPSRALGIWGFDVQKQLNVSRFYLEWRLFGSQGTLCSSISPRRCGVEGNSTHYTVNS